jgi:hypothetical protein
MPRMIPYDEVRDFFTGDIYVTKSVVPLVTHWAIAFRRNGVDMIADNSFINKLVNVFTLEDYQKSRDIYGIIRNNCTLRVTDDQVENAIDTSKEINYRFWVFNCQDFVAYASNFCYQGIDQRVKWGLILLGIIIVVLIFLK